MQKDKDGLKNWGEVYHDNKTLLCKILGLYFYKI